MRSYQSLIGVLRWICELGRVDLLVAVFNAVSICGFTARRTFAAGIPPGCIFEAQQAFKYGLQLHRAHV